MVAGRTGYPGKAFQNGSNTTLHGPQLTCNVFLAAGRRVGTSPMDSARSSIFTLGPNQEISWQRPFSTYSLFGRETHASATQSDPLLLPTRNGQYREDGALRWEYLF